MKRNKLVTLTMISIPLLFGSCAQIQGDKESNKTPNKNSPVGAETWNGACAERPDAAINLQLLSKSNWSMSLVGGQTESGTYESTEIDANFFANDSKLEVMKCEPIDDVGNVMSCKLNGASNIGFFDGCTVANFKLEQDDSAGNPEIGMSFPRVILDKDEPKLEHGSLALKASSTCSNKTADLTLKADGKYSLQFKGETPVANASAAFSSSTGEYFKTEQANEFNLYKAGALMNGQPSWPSDPFLTCNSKSGGVASGDAWECSVNDQMDINRLGCSEMQFAVK